MRRIAVVLVVAALLAAIGFMGLRDGSGIAETALSVAAEIVPRSAEREAGGKPATSTTDLASLVASSERSATPVKTVVYQWVDERGSVNFAASLDEVPAHWRERAGQIELDADSFAKPQTAPPSAPRSSRPRPAAFAESASAPVHEVTVYTAPWCGWCRKTLAFLDERGVDYVNKDIEADEEYADELEEKTGGSAIPFVEIDGSEIHGFDPAKMMALLK